MAGSVTQLEQFLAERIKQNKGVMIPVKAGVLEQILVRKVPIDRIHPNPDDEFCIKGVGPSYRIIGEYEEQIRRAQQYDEEPFKEPLIVEKVHPEGFMLLNGHHRWAAAMRAGLKKVPVKIVNLTQETNIEKMLQDSRHDRRVVFDLDEVIFRDENAPAVERKLLFPYDRIFKERLKLGVPGLFHFFTKNGYDIWLYSKNYYSLDYLQQFFRKHHVKVDGIVTGTVRNKNRDTETGRRMADIEKKVSDRYCVTIHIDNEYFMRIDSRTKA